VGRTADGCGSAGLDPNGGGAPSGSARAPHRDCPAATREKYRRAVELYASTSLSCVQICRQCRVSQGGLYAHLRRYHRDLILRRNGVRIREEAAAATIRLRGRRGQTPAARAKYGEAIRACDSSEYIGLNVSQVARRFGVSGTGLACQLRMHFPEILERRERERRRLGLNDNQQRGARPWCRAQYAAAVELLRTTDTTIAGAAEACGVSLSGLREHLLAYHKDIVAKRSARRACARSTGLRGALTGRGTRHEPTPEQVGKYGEAVRLYRTTALTQKEIVARTGVTLNGLRNHLRTWYPELILEHRGVKCSNRAAERKMRETKHYLKSTAAKYARAIRRLKATGQSTAEAARAFGLNPETFRMYLHEHEPELAARLGMTLLPNGRRVSARSMEKYAAAVRLYETTDEPLHSIARRLGLVYNSIFGFIRRNCPESVERHNRLAGGKISSPGDGSRSRQIEPRSASMRVPAPAAVGRQ